MKNTTHVVRALLCVLVLFATGKSRAQSATAPFTHQGITASTGDFLGFLQYKPEDYDLQPNTKYPIIIFLHGIGERGNGTTDLDRVAYVGLPRIIYKGNKMKFTWNGKTETFIVLAPQCPQKYYMWPAAFVNDLINYAKENLRIDTNRIYLTGLSMGGGGSLRYISDAASSNPKNLAAVATISAPCTFNNGRYAAEAHLPIWCFHAEDDPTASVECTKKAFAGLGQWNPSPKPLLNLWATGGHIVWDRVYTDTNYQYQGIVNIYEWFLGQNKSLPVNKLPVANAGGNRNTTGTTITLNASASSDEDGKLVRYVWKKLSGPAGGIIATPMSENPSTTFSGITIPGKYTFELAVVDDRAAFTRDTITVNVTSTAVASPAPVPDSIKTPPVKDSVSKPVPDSVVTTPVKDSVPISSPRSDTNRAPIAYAGIDVVTNTGWPQSLINATPSKDPDGWIVKASWTKVSGPSQYRILDSTALRTYATNLTVGVYTFRVTVTDNKGASASDDMTITVNGPSAPAVSPNIPPVANAGADVITNLGWPQSLINATPSRDPDGWIVQARWSLVSGPAQFSILDSTALRTYVTNLALGVYVFRITVTDNKGAVSTDDMQITVKKNYADMVAASSMISSNAMIGEPVEATVKEGLIGISPNPAVSTVQLRFSSSAIGETNIIVYDLNGRMVKQIVASKTQTMITQNVDVHDLAKGIYYAVAKTGNKSYAPIKFVKQ